MAVWRPAEGQGSLTLLFRKKKNPSKNNDQVVKSNPRESPKKNPTDANPSHKLKIFNILCMRFTGK